MQVVLVYSGYEALDAAIDMRWDNNIYEYQMRTFSYNSHPLSSIMYDILNNIMDDFKTPLAVVVAYDKQFASGLSVYEDIYHSLCRNANEPLVDGLDIPVYFQTNQENRGIIDVRKGINADKVVVLLLIDLCMFNGSDWTNYIDEVVKEDKAGTVEVLPVALCQYAFQIHPELGEQQYIRLQNYDIRDCWQEFLIRFYDDLIRTLRASNEKLQIFISHTKKDNDHLGIEKANELKAHLRADTKLNSFYDANDILDGYSFGDQIKENVKKSLLVILETETYSDREWCRIEAIVGKENHVPTVVVSLFNGKILRTFPYLGNTPKIRFDGKWDEVICLLLRTALDKYYEEKYLEKFKQADGKVIPMMPEFINIGNIDRVKQILYPEPPLGNEELEVVKRQFPNITFSTPSQLFANSRFLDGKNIAISISESPDSSTKGIGKTMFEDLSVELARHLLISGAHLVYGGDLSPGGFTELFKDLAYQYGIYEKDKSLKNYFTNYLAWPIYIGMTPASQAEYKACRVNCQKAEIPDTIPVGLRDLMLPPTTVENLYYWAESLKAMRQEMESHIDARIILGGRVTGFKGYMPGLYEEAVNAEKANHPIFLLGGFGGASACLIQLIKGETSSDKLFEECCSHHIYQEFVSYLDKEKEEMNFKVLDVFSNNMDILKNGLSKEDNERLFVTTNVTEIIALVLKGLHTLGS